MRKGIGRDWYEQRRGGDTKSPVSVKNIVDFSASRSYLDYSPAAMSKKLDELHAYKHLDYDLDICRWTITEMGECPTYMGNSLRITIIEESVDTPCGNA